MVHTRNQQGRDCSPAVTGRLTTTSADSVLDTSRSSVTATQVTAAGDLITTGSNPTLIGTPITKTATIVSDDGQISVGTHSRLGPAVCNETTLASMRVSPCIVGLRPHGDASANSFTLSNRCTGLIRPGGGVKSALTGAYYGPTKRTSLVTPPLRPNFLGEYRHGIR